MSIRSALAFAAALLLAGAAAAQAPSQFATLNPPQPVDGGGKIEVVEFFWYGCPHCYSLETPINTWLKKAPKDVVFKRVPAVPSENWGQMAVVFYTLETMGILDQYHPKVFEAMHDARLNLANKKIRDDWLAKNGIDPAKYDEVSKSFTVVTKVNRARQLTHAYKVDSVPRLFVNGKYYTSAEQAGGAFNVFNVVDQLVERVRKEKTASVPAAATVAQR